jgi:hypothetical protein
MITGSNTVYTHEGTEYHLQAEDLGREAATFEIRVYNQGAVVWQKRMSYSDLEAQELSRKEHEQALRTKMEKTILTVEAAIAKGKIG